MSDSPVWIQGLDEEDLHFLKRFLLQSGSLKALADEYGVSYPTLRLRLDRLIEKVNVLDKSDGDDEFTTFVRVLIANGDIEFDLAKKILASYKKQIRRK
ncbi:MAG: DUF2089 family protein [Bacteroidetes bacterium]|nr:DUF2089 family protein [Bacteroidota bacterium]